ncbi:MAG: hypothetical protein ACE144_15715 [Thermodesulfobacteriota bacterium]
MKEEQGRMAQKQSPEKWSEEIAEVIANLEKGGLSASAAQGTGTLLNDYLTLSFTRMLIQTIRLGTPQTSFFEAFKNSLRSILVDEGIERIGIDFMRKDFPDWRNSSLKDLNLFLYTLYDRMIPFFYFRSCDHLGRYIFLIKSHYDIFMAFLNKFTISVAGRKEEILEYIQSTRSDLYFHPEFLGLVFAAVVVELKTIFAEHRLFANNELIRKLLKYYERDALLGCFKYIDESRSQMGGSEGVGIVKWNEFLNYLANRVRPKYDVILIEGNCQEFKSIFDGHENILKSFFAEDKIIKLKRSGEDRRSGVDRRKFRDPNYRGAERRSGKDRRSSIERRRLL